jgi:TRAP-type mannitol/chloroaromatic compound transport system substrate-binding protein
MALHFLINLERWDALPGTYKAIIASAAAHANTMASALWDAENPKALRRLVASGCSCGHSLTRSPRGCLTGETEQSGSSVGS